MSTAVAGKGLAGVVAANSGICWIDGDAGVLAYRGIDIHELAEKSTFEETSYLLWFGQLPTKAELDHFSQRLKEAATWIPKLSIYCAPSPRAPTRWKCCAPPSPL